MKIGIVGNGGIVQQALRSLKDAEIDTPALWCRNEAKGKPVCDAFGIPELYTDYDEFLKDQSYDTVYIGLVNSLHYEYAKKALEAGKNAIVEKPFTVNYSQARDLVDTANEKGVYVFEAIMSRYTKNYDGIIPALDEIGDVRLVLCNYAQYSRRYNTYLEGKVLPAFDPNLAGGALYDINVYCIHFVTGLFGKPRFAYYSAVKGFNGIDTSGTFLMDYGDFKAVCNGAKDSSSKSFSIIQGSKGYIEIPNRPGFVKDVTLHKNNEIRIIDAERLDDPMRLEFERIQDAITNRDDAKVYNWMNITLNVMYELQEARNDIGLVFPGDETQE